jgi:hypothetical protein
MKLLLTTLLLAASFTASAANLIVTTEWEEGGALHRDSELTTYSSNVALTEVAMKVVESQLCGTTVKHIVIDYDQPEMD